MTEKFVKYIVVGASGVVTLAAGYLGTKLGKLSKKVGMAVEDLATAEAKDIQRELIEKSVEKAAKQEVRRYANDAANEALSGVRTEVKNQVKKAVNDAFDDMKTAVEDEISKQVAAIDQKALQKDVTEQAKKKILEKFDGNLDDILSDFSDNLDRVKKIHDRLADALMDRNQDNGKEIRFRVG